MENAPSPTSALAADLNQSLVMPLGSSAGTSTASSASGSPSAPKPRADFDVVEEQPKDVPKKPRTRAETIMAVQEALITREVTHELAGRRAQAKFLRDFLLRHLRDNTGGSLYICGSPGTGKTASLFQIKNNIQALRKEAGGGLKTRMVKLNGFEETSPQQVYVSLLTKLLGYDFKGSPAKAAERLKEIFLQPVSERTERYVVIVDEIDGLLSGNQRVLYKLFDWPKKPNANLILIGVANSMNLTDRFLPRLRQKGCEPDLLVFPTYTKDELRSIVCQRLQQFRKGPDDQDPSPFFDPIAIERVVGKVASMSGDIRRCLELCRTALDALLVPGPGGTAPPEKVGFMEMQAVVQSSFSSPFTAIIQELPFHQQVLVVTMALLFRRKPEPSFGQLNEYYKYATKKASMPHVSSKSEFSDMILNLSSQGVLVKLEAGGGSSRSKKVGFEVSSRFKFAVQEDDVKFGVQENPSLGTLLEKGIPIPSSILLN